MDLLAEWKAGTKGARLLGLALLKCCLLVAPFVAAEPSAADRATARTLAQQGYEALTRKDYAIAADRFSRAEALVHAPTLLRDLARSQVGLGKLVEAHETYNRILREGVPPNAPQSWHSALTEAAREVRELSPRLPWVTISVVGPQSPDVLIDDARLSPASLGVKRPLDPGKHRVRASSPGFLAREKTIELREGQTLTLALELEPAPAPASEASKRSESTPPPASPPPPATEERWRAPVTVLAFGLGGAGIVVGAVGGALAIDQRSELSRACDDGVCSEAQRRDIDKYHTLGTVSTLGFVTGGVGLAVGTVLLFTQPKRETKAASGMSWSPFVDVQRAGITGRF